MSMQTDEELWESAMQHLRDWGYDPDEIIKMAAATVERLSWRPTPMPLGLHNTDEGGRVLEQPLKVARPIILV